VTARARLDAVADHVRTPLYRDAYALLISNGLTSGLGVAYWALAARLFSPDAVGIASVLLSCLLFVSSVTQLNGRVALLRFVPETGPWTARFVARWYVAAGLGGLLIGVLFIITLDRWMAASPSLSVLADSGLAGWFVISIVVWSFFTMQDGLLTGLGKATIVPIENGFYAISKLLILPLMGAAAGYVAIFLSWTVPAAIAVVVITGYAFGRLIPAHTASRRGMPPPPRGGILGFLVLDYVAYVISVTMSTLLPALVVALSDATQGGYFYIPWVILTSFMLVPLYLSTSLTVQAASNRVTLRRQVQPTLIHIMRLLIPVVAGLVVFAPLILTIFGRQYSEEGATLLRVGAIGLIPYGVIMLYLSVARIRREGRRIVAVQTAVTVLTLGLSVILLPRMGISGVGVAWTTTNSLVAIAVLVFGLRPWLGHAVDEVAS